MQVHQGVLIERGDLKTTHEEADIIIVHQAFRSIIDNAIKYIYVTCDDTDVFVLLAHFYWKLAVGADILMQSTSEYRNILDILRSLSTNLDLMPCLLVAHAASECDTVAPYHGIGKLTIVKKLREGKRLTSLGYLYESVDSVSNYYGCLIAESTCSTKYLSRCYVLF